MAQAYAIYNKILDKIEANAGAVAETINGLAALLAKAKTFAKNYKGGKTEAAKAKAYEESIKKAQNALLKNINVPDSLKTALTTSQATAQAAWDFYKTGQPCTVAGNRGGGEVFFRLPLADCGAFSEAVADEAEAINNAKNSFGCSCLVGHCNEVTAIFNKIIAGNSQKSDFIGLCTNDFPLGSKNAENSGPAFNSGVEAGKNCFQVKIEAKFNTGTARLDLKNYIKLPAENKIVLKDERGEVGVEISLLPVNKGTLDDLERYLGFRGGNIEEYRIRAFMRMLRDGEGTLGETGYEKLFGGESFIKDHGKDWSDHPKIKIKRGNIKSSAAGAYQVMGYTWDESNMVKKRKLFEISDFSPESQDLFCIVLLKYKRPSGWDLLLKGKIEEALDIYSYEWASLPPPRYGQPVNELKTCLEIYEKNLIAEQNGDSPLHLKNGFLENFKNN